MTGCAWRPPAARYDQCDATCTVDCGHCKGQGKPTTAPSPDLCLHRRFEDGAVCASNKHSTEVEHGYRSIDPRQPLLDSLAETFQKAEQWAAYYHVRAVAHGLDFHLSGCVRGAR